MKDIKEYKIGDKAISVREITDIDVNSFAKLSGDNNPIHLDEEFAFNSIFKQRIAHGMFISSFISALIATELPGQGTIYLKQSLSFKAPAYLGETIITEVEIVEINEDKNSMLLKTTCSTAESKIVILGEALVVLSY